MNTRASLGACLALLMLASAAWAAPAPPRDVTAADHPWDNGMQVDVRWQLSPDDSTGVSAYLVFRSMTEEELKKANRDARVKAAEEAKKAGGVEAAKTAAAALAAEQAARAGEPQFKFAGAIKPGVTLYAVDRLDPEHSYLFQVVAEDAQGGRSTPATSQMPVAPVEQLFDGGRMWMAIITFILCGAVVAFILAARRGISLKVRQIAGLQAVDEAVGRATEMGRSVLFIPGIQDMNDIQTVAGITVLARVAKTAAEYDARVEVPTSRSLVMTTARETVQAAFLAAGRPDSYDANNIYYVTDEQFGYVAYLSGLMVREKPAACFYMGSFFAESLILAETGNSIGAIQIAGTAQPAQLPFFVAACDYTLIGEEFFAASAYLSGEPAQLGSLKGQDVGKLIVAVLLVLGCVLATYVALAKTPHPDVQRVLDYLTDTVLT